MRPVVILPTYQEAENIVAVLRRARAATPSDLLVVDDASPDGTADLALATGAEVGGVHLVRRPTKAGLGSAYLAGFTWALQRGYEAVVEMDADLSHDPADIPRLLTTLESGYDLVIGSRYVPGGSLPDWAPHRLALSRLGNLYARRALALGMRDATSGFRAYRTTLLDHLDLGSVQADGYGFQVEMAYRARRAGARIAEIPICFVERSRGTSKMSGTIVAEAMMLVTWWGIRHRLGAHRPATPARLGPKLG
jgi:dolichol-phosphate mannosyltransferase